jgi:mannan endo-1,4-beta-mannosidase
LNSDADIQATLGNMSKAGINVVRTWAFNGMNQHPTHLFFFPLFSFSSQIDVTEIPKTGSWLQLIQNGTSQINMGANGIQRLDKLIQFAKMNNMFVHFSLTNNWFPSVNQKSPNPSPRNLLSNDYGQYPMHFELLALFGD